MTETTKTAPRRSKEEIEASIQKTQAETAKLLAEAERARYEADSGGLLYQQAREAFEASRVTDDQRRVYRFNRAVDHQSVAHCVNTLWQWSRLDEENDRKPCTMEIVFSSPGGSIFDGFILFDEIQLLRARGHVITTATVGMSASMAGVLLQAGDHRWMGDQALVLIHRASFASMGKSYQVEDEIELVKRLEARILNIFETRSGGKLTKAKIKRNWERKDWWIESEEALELGIVDEVRGTLGR